MKIKSQSWIIIEIGIMLFVGMIVLTFYHPAYEKGVDAIVTVFALTFSNLLGSKSGGSMPQQAGEPKEGQTGTRTVETASTTETEKKPIS